MTVWKLVCSLLLAATLGAGAARAQEDPWNAIRAEYRAGDFESALRGLKVLLARRPDDREALYYTALIQWRLENFPAAASAYRRLLALDPEGPFAHDARLWLASYGNRGAIASPGPVRPTPAALAPKRPAASPRPGAASRVSKPASPRPSPRVSPSSSPRPTPRPASPAPRPSGSGLLPLGGMMAPTPTPAPWLSAQPLSKGRRPRSANALPGYFKVADGSFEFIPPAGFVLLDERVHGNELSALFGPPETKAVAPPTLLITWREVEELQALRADQRVARERRLLTQEASMYGSGVRSEARFGGPSLRVKQAQADWAADTLIFFKYNRLYTFTYGGKAAQLGRFRGPVDRSWETPIFYP